MSECGGERAAAVIQRKRPDPLEGAVDAGEANGGEFLESVLPDADDFPSAGFPSVRSCLLQLARLSNVKM